MRFVLSTIGTMGDVLPFVEVAAALRRRGHDAVLLANANFQGLAEKNGIEFHALGTKEEYLRLAQSEDLYHPLKGVKVSAGQWVLPGMRKTLDYLAAHRDNRGAVLVGSIVTLGLRIAHELYNLPLHSLVLSPFVFPSLYLTPISPGFSLPGWTPRPFKKAFQSVVNRGLDGVLRPGIDAMRAELGMAPLASTVRDWWLSPSSKICLFPAWFAPPQPDWPPGVTQTNFITPAAQAEEFSPELGAFMEREGRLAVVTMGSILSGNERIFQAMVRAFLQADFKVLLLSSNPKIVPSPAPPRLMQVAFAPLARVLQRASVIVHHAGIGTASAAMLARVPQLLMPHGHDQFDNAARLVRLGVARILPAGRAANFGPRDVSEFMADQQVISACQRAQVLHRSSPGLDEVCRLLEAR